MERLDHGCPHLGLASDADTHRINPDDDHRCYCLNAPRRVQLEQQAEFCLNENYQNCTVLAEAVEEQGPKRVGFLSWLAALVLLMAVATGFFIFGLPFDLSPQMNANAASDDSPRLVWSTPSVTAAPGGVTAIPGSVASAATPLPAVKPTMVPTTVPTLVPTVPPLPAVVVTPTVVKKPAAAPTATKAPAVQATKAPTAASATSQTPVANPTPFIHVVVKGDTLGNLAYKYKTTVAAIAQANGIKDVTKLELGQKLVIPR